MVVLITGQNGFTGSYLSQELRNHGYDVVGLKANLCDSDAISREVSSVRPQAVFHLAGISFVGHEHIREMYSVNLIGTYNLLAALAQQKTTLSSVILASSATVYGDSTSGLVSETASVNPPNDYAVSKLSMEWMAKCWSAKLPIVITRPFNYTGVNQSGRFLIPKIVEHFKRRAIKVELGNIDVFREFSDVRSVAMFYRRLLEVNPVGETINICSGRTYSIRQVIDMVSSLTRHYVKVEQNPALMRKNEIEVLGGDPSKLENLVGACETYTLQQTLDWMLNCHSSTTPSKLHTPTE